MTGDEDLFSMVFRTLIVLFSYGYNIETCKIIEATFLTLHCLPYARFFAGQRGAWPNGKYTTMCDDLSAYECVVTSPSIQRSLVRLPWPSRARFTDFEACGHWIIPRTVEKRVSSLT